MKADYEREGIRLYCADCRDVLPLLVRESCDALVTDPPYGIVNEFGVQNKSDGGVRTMQFAWDDDEITGVVMASLKLCSTKLSKRAGCFVFCGGDQFGRVLNEVREMGFTAKPAAWVKTCPPPAGKGNWWPSAFEFAVYGYKPRAYFGDTDPKRSNVFIADSYRYGQPGKVDHPTQKPLRLISRIVEAIVRPGGVALEPFLGSGTTAVACVRLGRGCVGIEKSRKYFDIAVKRIEAEFDRAPLFTAEKESQTELFT